MEVVLNQVSLLQSEDMEVVLNQVILLQSEDMEEILDHILVLVLVPVQVHQVRNFFFKSKYGLFFRNSINFFFPHF